MGGLGDVYQRRRSGGLGEYLKLGALDGLKPAERHEGSTDGGDGQSRGTFGYSGTLFSITRGFDGKSMRTDCHYFTPVGTFTISDPGTKDCPLTAPAPRGIGGSNR
jgi:hypothetical protein